MAAKKPSVKSEIKSMDDLLKLTNHQIVVPKKGQTVKGKVSNKSGKVLTLDIGAKTEGVVTEMEFEAAVDYIKDLKIGDEIDAIVLLPENNRGQTILSLKHAASDAKWDFFQNALDKQEIIEVKGIETNKGGLIVDALGLPGFIPSSQFSKEYIGNFKQLKGQKVKVKAIEVEREKNRLIFSERHVSEAEEMAHRDEALTKVKSGEICTGVVSGVMPFGLFVTAKVPLDDAGKNFGHVEGLIHISEISWEKVNHPKDYHQVGDEVQVKILGVDEETGKLNLSLKQLTEDPWQKVAKDYPAGTTFTGKVSRVEVFGVFVNVEPGVDGLIHASKLSPDQTFKTGDEVTVTVEGVEAHERRMSLSVVETTVPMGYK